MSNADVISYSKKAGLSLTRDEAILEAVNQIDNSTQNLLPPPLFVGFYDFISDYRFRGAVRRYARFAAHLLDKYGDPNDYAVLNLHSSSRAEDVDKVSKNIELIHKVRLIGENPLILLSNEEVISRLESGLKERGFVFSEDWKSPKSEYQTLLRAALKRGTIYDMVKSRDIFSFVRVRDSIPKSDFWILQRRMG